MRYQDSQAEGKGCSYAVAPVGEMQCLAETGQPRFAGIVDEEIHQFMKEIQAIRDSSQIDEGGGQEFGRQAEQAKEKQQGAYQNEGPADRGLQNG